MLQLTQRKARGYKWVILEIYFIHKKNTSTKFLKVSTFNYCILTTTPKCSLVKNNTSPFLWFVLFLYGALEGSRTPDLCLRRALLYPTELQTHWSGRRESNSRSQLGRLAFYHWTTPAYEKKNTIIYKFCQHFLQKGLCFAQSFYCVYLNKNCLLLFNICILLSFVN